MRDELLKIQAKAQKAKGGLGKHKVLQHITVMLAQPEIYANNIEHAKTLTDSLEFKKEKAEKPKAKPNRKAKRSK